MFFYNLFTNRYLKRRRGLNGEKRSLLILVEVSLSEKRLFFAFQNIAFEGSSMPSENLFLFAMYSYFNLTYLELCKIFKYFQKKNVKIKIF